MKNEQTSIFVAYLARHLLEVLCILLLCSSAHAQAKRIRIGVIASLSGFAAPYGTAVVNGAKVAQAELEKTGFPIDLFIEDDQSQIQSAATAYQKLKFTKNIQGLIGGSWWINGIVKTVERDGIPLLSCETMYNKDFVQAKNYFTLAGDLRDWVRAYNPIIEARKWKSALFVRFISGFADTVEDELKKSFSGNGKQLLETLEYSDIEMSSASTLATKALSLQPDVIFLDAQPQSFAKFINEVRKQQGKRDVTIATYPAAEDAFKQKLFDPFHFHGEIFFLRRSSFSGDFLRSYQTTIGEQPLLNADLGYYAALLLAKSISAGSPIQRLHEGVTIGNSQFVFDENHVSSSVRYDVHTFVNGAIEKVPSAAK